MRVGQTWVLFTYRPLFCRWADWGPLAGSLAGGEGRDGAAVAVGHLGLGSGMQMILYFRTIRPNAL